MTPAISIRNLSKCYRLGTIGRHTLVDEAQYWWHKARGRDPREYFSKVGHTATEVRKVEAERSGAEQFWALKDVSFDVEPGAVIGIIGRNGAGKSTLLKILTRITEPTSGEAFINGRVASLLEVGTGFHPDLTGRENVYMNGTILGMKRREIAAKFDEIVAFSELEQFIDTPVKRYSSGMYVRLAFAVAAHLEPEILLIDEVLAVGDMEFQRKCLGKMETVSKMDGRTILFVSHNMGAIQGLCSKVILLRDGCVAFQGDTMEGLGSYREMSAHPPPDMRAQIQSLPGDPVFEWLDVAVRQEGVSPDQFSNGKPIEIALTYRLRRDVRGFHVYFRIRSLDDIILTESLSDGQIGTVEKLTPGVYCSRGFLPANLLNEGEYKMDMFAAIHNVRRIYPTPLVMPLRVLRDGLVNCTYPDYRSPAKLLPHVAWNTTAVEAP